MDTNSSKLERLMERQQVQHEENKGGISSLRQGMERLGKLLVGEQGTNGLIGTVTSVKSKLESVETSLDRIDQMFEHLPKKILTYLLIFTALIALLEFLAPALRKTLGLAASHHTFYLGEAPKSDANNSASFTYRMSR